MRNEVSVLARHTQLAKGSLSSRFAELQVHPRKPEASATESLAKAHYWAHWLPKRSPHHRVSLSSSLSYSLSSPSGFRNSALLRPITSSKPAISITCSTSEVHSYGAADYQRRPQVVKWKVICKRISFMENPELGSRSVLNQWEKEGKKFTKWELCRVVKELRKFRRYKLALEVYEWMNNRGERFRILTSDAAIQLDLVAKVRGLSSAEDYFLRLPDSLKDNRTYGALLNAYVQAKEKEKAESLIEEMRSKGYAVYSLSFNVMMTLYMNLKDYDKVDLMVSEMMERNIPLDIYTYNIWLSSCGSRGTVEKMEQVFEQMKLDTTIIPNWTTFSTMATMYIKLGDFKKAEKCLKDLESRITGRDRIAYHYLISLYGGVDKAEEIHRVWNIYKSVYPIVHNLGYYTVISSLVRLGDIEGAEKIYNEWLQVKTKYDPRIGNILMGWYVKEGLLEKAEGFFDQMVEVGGKVISSTWEILAEGYIGKKRISEAMSCLNEACLADGSERWKPKPVNMSTFLKLCEQEDDTKSTEALMEVLRRMGCLEDEAYMSYVSIHNGVASEEQLPIESERIVDVGNDTDDGGADTFLYQFQESL